METLKDFFPILQKIINPEEKYFDSTDAQLFYNFQKAAQKHPHLYLWFNEEIRSLAATFHPPEYLPVMITKDGWHIKGHTLQFGETPVSMIGVNQPIIVTVFQQKILLNPTTESMNERFIKRMREIIPEFLIVPKKHCA